MRKSELSNGRGHVIAVLLANAILWVAAVVISDQKTLGGLALIGLISIGSLLWKRHRN